MPQIKQYEQQVQPTGPVPVQRATGEDFGSGAAQALDSFGNTMAQAAKVARQRDEQQDVSDLNAKIAQAHVALTSDYTDQLKNGTLNVDDFKDSVQSKMDGIQQGVQTRAGRLYFQTQQAELSKAFLEKAIGGSASLAGLKAVSDSKSSNEARSSALITDPSDKNFELSLQQQNDGIDALVATGGLPSKEADELKRSQATELAKSAAKGWMLADPDMAEQKIKSGLYDAYIKGDTKYQLLGEVHAAKVAKVTDEERIRKQQQEVLKDQQKKVQDDFIARLNDNNLSAKDVLNSNLDPFGSGSKEAFMGLIRQKNKETADDKIKTDPYVMTQLFNRIHAPDSDPKRLSDENELNKYFGKGLDLSSLKLLRNEIQDKGTVQGDADAQLSKNFTTMAYTAIAKPDPITKLPDPQGAVNYQTWLSDMLAQKQKALANGKKAIDLFNPKSPDYLGNNINQYQRTPDQIIQDMVKGRQQASPSPSSTPAPSEPMVDVEDPNGRPGKLPKSKIEDAKKRGFKVK